MLKSFDLHVCVCVYNVRRRHCNSSDCFVRMNIFISNKEKKKKLKEKHKQPWQVYVCADFLAFMKPSKRWFSRNHFICCACLEKAAILNVMAALSSFAYSLSSGFFFSINELHVIKYKRNISLLRKKVRKTLKICIQLHKFWLSQLYLQFVIYLHLFFIVQALNVR